MIIQDDSVGAGNESHQHQQLSDGTAAKFKVVEDAGRNNHYPNNQSPVFHHSVVHNLRSPSPLNLQANDNSNAPINQTHSMINNAQGSENST